MRTIPYIAASFKAEIKERHTESRAFTALAR
jgi:hypothetical protein